MTESEGKPLPCPRCQAKAKVWCYGFETTLWGVRCTQCPLEMKAISSSPEEIIAMWNTRTPTQPTPSPVEPTEEQINAAAEVMWNDRDARMGGPWSSRDQREVVVIQTKATARAALIAAHSPNQSAVPASGGVDIANELDRLRRVEATTADGEPNNMGNSWYDYAEYFIDHHDEITAALRGAPSPASEAEREAVERRIRNDALEEAACIARNGCLVPPDGGSPTEAEAELCESIASMIRLRKLASPPHPANQMDQIAVSPANKELEEALKRWYRAYHHGSMEDETLQSELLAKAYADQLTQPANPDEGMRS